MPKSFSEMSPDELQQLGDTFTQLMQKHKESTSMGDRSSTPDVPPSDDSLEDESSAPAEQPSQPTPQEPSLFNRVSQKMQEKTPDMTQQSPAPEEESSPARQPASPPALTKQPPLPEAPAFQEAEGRSLMDRYKEAQQRANLLTLINQLGKSGAMIGSGVAAAGGKGMIAAPQVDTKNFDTNIALAQKLPEQVKEQMEMEKHDPTSDTSRSARDFIKKTLNVAVPDNISASQLKEQFPVIEKFLQAKENAAARADARHTAEKDKAERNDDRDFVRLGEKLEGGIASSRSVLGKADSTIRAAKSIKALIGNGDPNQLDSRQIAEVARGLDFMISQGAASIEGTKKLIPSTLQGKVANLQEYFSSLPQGAQQGAFAKKMMDTIDREVKAAEDTKKEIKERLTAGYSHLQKHDPERFENILKKHGLTTDEDGNASIPPSQPSIPQQTQPMAPQGENIRVRSKKTGTVKVLPSDTAQKYLAHPEEFEVVQ